MAAPCCLQDLKFPHQGLNLHPLQWKYAVLTWTTREVLLTAVVFFNFLFCTEVSPVSKQCCDSFRWTVQGLSHMYTCIHSTPKPAFHPGCHITLNGVPCVVRRSLLVIHFKYSCLIAFCSGCAGSWLLWGLALVAARGCSSLVAVCSLLLAAAFLVAKHGL